MKYRNNRSHMDITTFLLFSSSALCAIVMSLQRTTEALTPIVRRGPRCSAATSTAVWTLLPSGTTRSTITHKSGPLRAASESASPSAALGGDAALSQYWEENAAKWEKTLRILDVRAAYASGSLNGILPSGRPSRVSTNDQLISLTRALELFEADEQNFLVRRRFRQMKVAELRPRWDKVMAKRSALLAAGKWDTAIEESEKYRDFQKTRVKGEVDSFESSPAFSRAIVTLLSPALKAAAWQRDKADGGIMQAQVELLEAGGSNTSERWITAALLAQLEEELQTTIVVPSAQAAATASSSSSSSPSFATQEAEQDIQDAGSGALYGVLLALVTAVVVASLQQL